MLRYDKINKLLRKNKIVLKMYLNFFSLLFSLDPIIPMEIPVKLLYRVILGRKLDLKNPVDLNEKIQWLKVYYRDPRYVNCADKYLVREYVKQQNHEDILNELYGVYDMADEIKFNQLPNEFVLKATHSSGRNIICNDKSNLNIEETKIRIKKWLNEKHGLATGETHYLHIKPRIIAEKYIGNDDGTLPLDYKIFCFNGRPHCVVVYSDRDKVTLETKRSCFNFNWEPLDLIAKEYYTDPSGFKRPETLDYMYEVAKNLSRPFPFVRVDLYEYKGKVIFGELTFTPAAGFLRMFTQEANIKLGKLLKLPEKSKSTRWT